MLSGEPSNVLTKSACRLLSSCVSVPGRNVVGDRLPRLGLIVSPTT